MSKPKKQSSSSGTYTPTKMRDAYRRIAAYKAAGMKDTEIAQIMNVSPQMVGYVQRSPLVRQQIEELHDAHDAEMIDVAREIMKATPVALATVIEIMMDGPDAKTKLRAAESILDRNPSSSKHSTQRVERGGYSKEEISRIKSEAIQRAQQAGILPPVEDAVYEDIEEGEEE